MVMPVPLRVRAVVVEHAGDAEGPSRAADDKGRTDKTNLHILKITACSQVTLP